MSDRDVLSAHVRPTHYALDLRNLDFAKWTYDGTVAIDVEISSAIKEITINANHLEFKNAKLLVDGVVKGESTSFSQDASTQSVTITFGNEISATKAAVLDIAFQGILNDAMVGFYRSTYRPAVDPAASVARSSEGTCHVLATQFQTSDARRAFPCFDAPNIKATFDFSIEVPTDQVALGNMPVKSTTPTKDGWHVVAFETTPKMSTYLLAWAVGDFGYVETFSKKIPVRIYAVRGNEDQGNFSAGIAPKALELFSDLFGIPYPLPKMDLLAIPEIALLGMENWGLITAQPSGVLLNDKTANEGFKQGVATNVCHEISHQWFGNLVTMEWWDEVWLNEGFATWLGNYAVDHLFPEWNTWPQFIGDHLEFAFRQDSLRTTNPVLVPVASGMLAHQSLNALSYAKGCSVIRMLVNYLGTETFMKGVSNYVKANEYANASAESLWKHLGQASGKDVLAMADTWIRGAGYPVLAVEENASKNEISVAQSRFLASGDVSPEDDKLVWHIPLGIRGLEGGQGAFLSEKRRVISGIDLDFYLVNSGGTGFYRVMYPPSRLAKLSSQLDRLSPQDKISIIASTAALATAGSISVTSLLDFLQGFRHEKDTSVWLQIIDVLATISGIFADNKQTQSGLNHFKVQLFAEKTRELGVDVAEDDTFASRGLRRSLNIGSIRAGNQEVIDKYMPLFEKWESNGKIDPSILPAVLCAAMFKDPTRVYDILKDALFNSNQPDERVVLATSIARTNNEEFMRKLPALTFANSPASQALGPMEMASVIGPLSANPVGRQIQWQWMKENWDTVMEKVGNPILMDHCVRMTLAEFATEEALADIEAFFKDKDTEGYAQTLNNAKEEIRSRAAFKHRDAQLLEQWLGENKYIQ